MKKPDNTKTNTLVQSSIQLDRWHFMDYPDNAHVQNYIEWKYFNFIQKDLAGYILYYVLDPEQKTKLGGGRLIIRLFRNQKRFGGLRNIDVSNIQLDSISADATMDQATLAEKNVFEYDIQGNVNDISWALDYIQKTPTIDSFSDTNPGLFKWESMNWLIKMPKAEVQGKLSIGKKIIKVNGLGYSDANWGEMMPLLSRYEWGQFNDNKTSIVFGILYKIQKINRVYLYVTIGEEVIRLENVECKIKHVGWIKDAVSGLTIPSRSILTFRSKSYTVKITSSLIDYDIRV